MSRIIKGEAELDDVDKIDKLNFYNHIVDFKALRLELLFLEKTLGSLKIKKSFKNNSVFSISQLFHENNLAKDFPQMEHFIRKYLALPISSVTAERAFSAITRIKTNLRNLVSQDRISALAIISIEKDIPYLTENKKHIKSIKYLILGF